MDNDRRQDPRKNKSTRRSFYRDSPTIKFKKGETIFLQDQIPKSLYSIKNGVIEEYNITTSGDLRTIAFEIVGDIIPKGWVFSKTSHALFFYRAHTDCELYVIDKKDFLLQLNNNNLFTNKMLDRAISSLMGSKLQIDALEKPNANLKLLYILRYFLLTYGKETSSGIVKIQIPFTQQEIANFTGLTRETVTLKIDRLKNQKILFCKQKIYSVDVAKLNILINDSFNSEGLANMLPANHDASGQIVS